MEVGRKVYISQSLQDKYPNLEEKAKTIETRTKSPIKEGSRTFALDVGQMQRSLSMDAMVCKSHLSQTLTQQKDECSLPICLTEQRKSQDEYSVSLLAKLLPNCVVTKTVDDNMDVDSNIMLNASHNQEWISPSSSEWSLCEGSEKEHNMSILPTDMLDPEIPLSQSCWEVESQRSQLQFCFTSSFQQCEKMETPATKQGLDSPCLSSPCDVAVLANRRTLFK